MSPSPVVVGLFVKSHPTGGNSVEFPSMPLQLVLANSTTQPADPARSVFERILLSIISGVCLATVIHFRIYREKLRRYEDKVAEAAARDQTYLGPEPTFNAKAFKALLIEAVAYSLLVLVGVTTINGFEDQIALLGGAK